MCKSSLIIVIIFEISKIAENFALNLLNAKEPPYYTVKNFYVNLTESPGSPSNRQYYFICLILTANL